MGDLTTPGTPRKRVLCLLRNGPSPEVLRWTAALAQDHEVELFDLTQAGLDYEALLKQIFDCERVISW
jgi:hypothetical protein